MQQHAPANRPMSPDGVQRRICRRQKRQLHALACSCIGEHSAAVRRAGWSPQRPRDRRLVDSGPLGKYLLADPLTLQELDDRVLQFHPAMHDDASVAPAGNALPHSFCWTRFGTEAGETIEAILARKEAERQANDGVVLLGDRQLGRACRRGACATRRRARGPVQPDQEPAPASRCRAPIASCGGRLAEGLSGDTFELPSHATVTSRWDPTRPARGALRTRLLVRRAAQDHRRRAPEFRRATQPS